MSVYQEITLPQMLAARDARALRQQVLLGQYRCPVISFTMNIAGPVKYTPLIRRGFALGCRLLRQRLAAEKIPVLFAETICEPTGCEARVAADADAAALKALTAELEDASPVGRLFDMDVLSADGVPVSRAALGRPERRCLCCGGPAKACARSRTHSVAELQAAANALLTEAVDEEDAETAARLATQALLYEVCTTPKPGLVDRANNGSHRDMDIFTFMGSSAALWPYFARCAAIGRKTASQPAPQTFAALRSAGRQAEAAMLHATGGVNTHKGAVFTMGALCAALGRLDREQWGDAARILSEVSAMAAGIVERELAGLTEETARTTGQKLYVAYGITGVRGQLEEGLPAVLHHGLPRLRQGLRDGVSTDRAGAAALLAILANTTDTNLIARSDRATQQSAACGAAMALEQAEFPTLDTLRAMDRAYIEKNLSPGGSADLLAVCWLLYFLEQDAKEDAAWHTPSAG